MSNKKEVWKDIEGYKGCYQVSSHGRVKSLDRHLVDKAGVKRFYKGKILRPEIDKDGYEKVDLRRKGTHNKQIVHRLVAYSFIENPNNYPVINHIDEKKRNNRAENLEWCTVRYNHAYGNARENNVKTLRKPVIGVHVETGHTIEFESITEAVKNGFSGHISSVINGRRKTSGGYYWKLKKET